MNKIMLIVLAGSLLLAACAQPSALTATPSPTRLRVTLRPYLGPTLTATPSPTNAATLTPLPTATPTPRTHVIRSNEDMLGIAFQYGITLNDLQTANPSANPRALRVGDSLTIPASQSTPTPDPDHPPLPTPVGLTAETPQCSSTAAGGLWCFAILRNTQRFAVEGVSAAFHLRDRTSGEIETQTAYPDLNRLEAGGWLPLAAYFSAPAPAQFEVSLELLTALPIPVDSGRYLTLADPAAHTALSADGLSAQVSGGVSLASGQNGPALVTLTAVAQDQSGAVIGLRSLTLESALESGEELPFTLTVYSSGAAIAQVLLLQEAVPAP